MPFCRLIWTTVALAVMNNVMGFSGNSKTDVHDGLSINLALGMKCLIFFLSNNLEYRFQRMRNDSRRFYLKVFFNISQLISSSQNACNPRLFVRAPPDCHPARDLPRRPATSIRPSREPSSMDPPAGSNLQVSGTISCCCLVQNAQTRSKGT